GRPPAQPRAAAARLDQYMPHHVFRPHAFSRALVMRAPGGVDVMVSRIPSECRRVDPASKPEIKTSGVGGADRDGPGLGNVFGPAAAGHRELARRKTHRFTVG